MENSDFILIVYKIVISKFQFLNCIFAKFRNVFLIFQTLFLLLLLSFLDPDRDIGHQQVILSEAMLMFRLQCSFWTAPQIAGLSRQRVLGLPAEFDIREPHPQSLVIYNLTTRQWLKTAAHYEYRRCMHVGPRDVFYFPPTFHTRKAFPYPPPGDAFNRGCMLPEGYTF